MIGCVIICVIIFILCFIALVALPVLVFSAPEDTTKEKSESELEPTVIQPWFRHDITICFNQIDGSLVRHYKFVAIKPFDTPLTPENVFDVLETTWSRTEQTKRCKLKISDYTYQGQHFSGYWYCLNESTGNYYDTKKYYSWKLEVQDIVTELK